MCVRVVIFLTECKGGLRPLKDKKRIFQELALYQSESRNFGLCGLFVE